jgi:hypothetical protein
MLNRREIPPLREPTPSQERRRRKSVGSLQVGMTDLTFRLEFWIIVPGGRFNFRLQFWNHRSGWPF